MSEHEAEYVYLMYLHFRDTAQEGPTKTRALGVVRHLLEPHGFKFNLGDPYESSV